MNICSYSKYASICSQTVRQALKPEIKNEVKTHGDAEFLYTRWKNGAQEKTESYNSAKSADKE